MGQPQWTHPDQMSLRSTCFDGPSDSRWKPWVYTHEVLLEVGAVGLLRRCSKKYGSPFDTNLLSLTLAATFRAQASVKQDRGFAKDSSTDEVMSLALTMYA